MGDQPRRLVVQELWKIWKLHAKLLAENRMAKPATNKKVTKASDLRIGQLVLVKNHCRGPFNPTYIYDHWVAGILNKSTVLLTTPDGKEKKCNIHHIKLVSPWMYPLVTAHKWKFPQLHSPNSGTASNRTLVVMTVLTAILSIHTTYSQKQGNDKYIHSHKYIN